MCGLLLAATSDHPVLIVVGLGLVMVGHNTMLPAFWCLPSSFLRGVGAAAGIALINSLGNLGGFFGPNLLGTVKGATGSYSPAFYGLAGLMLVAVLTTISLRSARALAR
jgi:ACS family tartrate transporter-like MFS transporter